MQRIVRYVVTLYTPAGNVYETYDSKREAWHQAMRAYGLGRSIRKPTVEPEYLCA